MLNLLFCHLIIKNLILYKKIEFENLRLRAEIKQVKKIVRSKIL